MTPSPDIECPTIPTRSRSMRRARSGSLITRLAASMMTSPRADCCSVAFEVLALTSSMFKLNTYIPQRAR